MRLRTVAHTNTHPQELLWHFGGRELNGGLMRERETGEDW